MIRGASTTLSQFQKVADADQPPQVVTAAFLSPSTVPSYSPRTLSSTAMTPLNPSRPRHRHCTGPTRVGPAARRPTSGSRPCNRRRTRNAGDRGLFLCMRVGKVREESSGIGWLRKTRTRRGRRRTRRRATRARSFDGLVRAVYMSLVGGGEDLIWMYNHAPALCICKQIPP